MAIYMLFDNTADKQILTFLNGYETAGIRQVYPLKKCDSIKKMLAACKDMIKNSTDGDTIICWYDFMAILCWWLCKFKLENRKIVALNILLKDKATVKKQVSKAFIQASVEIEKGACDCDFSKIWRSLKQNAWNPETVYTTT